MAIQVGGTTVISNNRALSSVNGLKTIQGSSILGSGDIAISGGSDIAGGYNTATSGTRYANNQGTSSVTVVSGSTNGRFFRGNLSGGNAGNPDNTNGSYSYAVNGNDSFYAMGPIDFGFVAPSQNFTVNPNSSHGYVTWSFRYKDA